MTEAIIVIDPINPNLKVIQFDGQLDESNVDEKIKTIYHELEMSKPDMNYILDFTNLNYINSKTIGYLTDIYGKIVQGGGKVVVAGAKPNITDILQVVGLTQLLELYHNMEDAKKVMFALTGDFENQETPQQEALQTTNTPVTPASTTEQQVNLANNPNTQSQPQPQIQAQPQMPSQPQAQTISQPQMPQQNPQAPQTQLPPQTNVQTAPQQVQQPQQLPPQFNQPQQTAPQQAVPNVGGASVQNQVPPNTPPQNAPQDDFEIPEIGFANPEGEQ